MSPQLRIRKRLRALVPQTIQAFASGQLAVPDLKQQAEMARAITGNPTLECLIEALALAALLNPDGINFLGDHYQAAPRQIAQLVKEGV